MQLIIDTEKVESFGLNLNEYMILLIAYYKEVGEEFDYSSTQEELQKLEREMYIKITPRGAVLREKGWKLFESSPTDKFEEFLSIYPKTVPSGGGQRITAPKSGTTWANALRREWGIITHNNLSLQEEIVNKLKYDISERERTGGLMYLPGIENWLGKRTWENIEIQSNNNPFDKCI